MPFVKYFNAIAEAVDEEMQRDERVFVVGEDVGKWGGVWGTSRGLYQKYGAKRAVDAPISESAIVGTAVGAALTGLRPIAEIMYIDFITCAMDQVINQAAKLRLMSGNKLTLPLVIRTPAGCGTMEAAQHSQNLEAWFVHSPGLKVVMPYTVCDAKGLLKSAIRDDNPVLFIEHRCLYGRREELPEGEILAPIGKAIVRRQGGDVTVISYSRMLDFAIKAAEQLDNQISVEVIDLRTLVPLDVETIVRSVGKTRRALIVHEAPVRCGFGAEIVRVLNENCFDNFAAAPKVIGGANIPIPYSPGLERSCIPQTEDIVAEIKKLHAIS
jgi:pyruvate/2-oxoglutarate/acetoin dehydrogenase E1 component